MPTVLESCTLYIHTVAELPLNPFTTTAYHGIIAFTYSQPAFSFIQYHIHPASRSCQAATNKKVAADAATFRRAPPSGTYLASAPTALTADPAKRCARCALVSASLHFALCFSRYGATLGRYHALRRALERIKKRNPDFHSFGVAATSASCRFQLAP